MKPNWKSLPLPSNSAAAVVLLLAVASSIFAAGAADLTAHRARLQIAQEPANAERVLDVQNKLVAAKKKPAASKTADVVVVGQIGGMPNIWPDTHPAFPWYTGQSSFFLVDTKVAALFAKHAKLHGGNHNCAYCRSQAAKFAHAAAVVNLVDEQGKIMNVDSRELFGLTENQTVIVRGKAQLLGGRLLVIDATAIYVPPRSAAAVEKAAVK